MSKMIRSGKLFFENNKWFEKVKDFIPSYAYKPLCCALILNFVAYYGTRVFTDSMVHYSFVSKIDQVIPFSSIFIIFYLLAYLQWIVGYIVISKESKEICYSVLFADVISKSVCMLCFLLIPTTMVRAFVYPDNFSSILVSLVYQHDAPVNLFPSIHCLESWICFRGIMKMKTIPVWCKWVMFIISILVCASTVLVKQHVFVDVIAGIAVAELGIFFSKKWNKKNPFLFI